MPCGDKEQCSTRESNGGEEVEVGGWVMKSPREWPEGGGVREGRGGGKVEAGGTACMEPPKRDRVGKLEKLKELKSLDCHFVVLFSRSLLPTPRRVASPLSLSPPLALTPIHSNCPFIQLFQLVSST